MLASIGDHLRVRRESAFVGRVHELAELDRVLASAATHGNWPFHVLHLWGVGGIGKTTLLGQFYERARRGGVPFLELDARYVAPNPRHFVDAWEHLARTLPEAARAGRMPWILAIDTYESVQALDGWLRDRFLPSLPAGCLVILAGRHRPDALWTADPVWAGLARLHEIGSLTRDDTRKLLEGRLATAGPAAGAPVAGFGDELVSQERLDAVFRMTSGHPLAVALVAAEIEAVPDWLPTFESAGPAIIEGLVSRFLDEAPSPAHREALEIASIAMFTNQDLLADVLPHADSYALIRWLGGLAFMMPSEHGLATHDLAREAIFGDLRRRSPDHIRHLRIHIFDALARRASFDHKAGWPIRQLVYLHRSVALIRPFIDLLLAGDHWTEPGTPADHAAVLAMTAQYEGEASAALVARWLAVQPEALTVARSMSVPDGGLSGYILIVRATTDAPLNRLVPEDPAAVAFTHAVAEDHALAPGDVALFVRSWMSQAGHQRIVDAAQMAVFYHQMQAYLSTPRLALSAVAFTNAAVYRDVMAIGDFPRVPAGDFIVGERTHGLYFQDWRKRSPIAWLTMMGRRDRPEAAPAASPAIAASGAHLAVVASVGLRVGPEASWFELPGEPRVDLSTRKTLRVLLWQIVAAHRDAPGRATSLEALQEAGWPGEQMSFHSGRQRVYVAISTLRKLGLQAVLTSTEAGYLIPQSLAVELVAARP